MPLSQAMGRLLQTAPDQHVRQLYPGEAPSRYKSTLHITHDIQSRLRIHKVRDRFTPIHTRNHQCRLILDVRVYRPLKHGRLLATIFAPHAEIHRVLKLSLQLPGIKRDRSGICCATALRRTSGFTKAILCRTETS
jgi:hypothetical protein